ncbi:MAG: isopeptide-forming domain-containing fimbrial protein, partial [Clostridia bacterium]|nr:isopeptide-forming domain-containing fimbrial protein [Clostridia bacterium]
MKKFTKIFAVVMTMAMLLCMALPTLAAPAPVTGSITINGVVKGNTYSVYQLLDLESYDTDSGAYSYKVNSAWSAFFATADAKAYFAVDTSNYATWIATEDDASYAAFAKLALAYAKANDIAAVDTKTVAEGETKVEFTGLALGYYLVDSSLGALCGLTTTNPSASLSEKNGPPTVEKQVKEDSTNQWGTTNSADIGQTVEFRATISVHAGAESYVFHDKMSAGLTFDAASVKVVHFDTSADTTKEAPAEYYTLKTSELTDDCTFEIVFTQAFCDHLDVNDKVVISYNAMLNRDAVIAGAGNPNECSLKYGENNYTVPSITKTFTFGIDIV